MIDITRLELPTIFGMKTVNSYLLKGDCVALVDTGENTDKSYEALSAALKNSKLTVQDIDEIIITHAHVDHIGMTGRIVEESGAVVKVSDLVHPWAMDHMKMLTEREAVIDTTMAGLMPPATMEFFRTYYEDFKKGMLKAWSTIPNSKIQVFNHDEGIVSIAGKEWKTVYCPGHSSTQSCFYKEDTRQFLSADMLLKVTPTPVIEPLADGSMERTRSIFQLLESYDKLRKMDFSMVYPGHYELIEDHISYIDHQVKRIHERKEETLGLINSGITDMSELFNKLYKGRWHLPALVMMIGYLDLLESEGKIEMINGQAVGRIVGRR